MARPAQLNALLVLNWVVLFEIRTLVDPEFPRCPAIIGDAAANMPIT
ncbi:MAG: hypothetical protein R2855_10005 [Thermomicrobiales bacterium]